MKHVKSTLENTAKFHNKQICKPTHVNKGKEKIHAMENSQDTDHM